MNVTQTEIWNSTQDKLKNFVFKLTRDREIAADIVQDVFLKVHAKINQVKDSDKLTGWIYRIARNTITDYYRGRSKAMNLHDIDWESDKNSLNDCVSGCLSDMLTTLPRKYREALELTELSNVSQLELAKALNISYSGAKSRVQRARQMLKQKMEENFDIQFDRYGNVIVCENRTPCNCQQSTIQE